MPPRQSRHVTHALPPPASSRPASTGMPRSRAPVTRPSHTPGLPPRPRRSRSQPGGAHGAGLLALVPRGRHWRAGTANGGAQPGVPERGLRCSPANGIRMRYIMRESGGRKGGRRFLLPGVAREIRRNRTISDHRRSKKDGEEKPKAGPRRTHKGGSNEPPKGAPPTRRARPRSTSVAAPSG